PSTASAWIRRTTASRPRLRRATSSRWGSAASPGSGSSRGDGLALGPGHDDDPRGRSPMSDAPRGNGAPSAPDSERSGSAARTGRHVFHGGAAILFSRIVGLIRQRVFAHYFGISAAGDAYSAAFRIPNFLQNIFGEGALSGSYIPVYSNLLARGEKEQASRVANTVFALLALATSAIVLVGVRAAPYLVDVIA